MVVLKRWTLRVELWLLGLMIDVYDDGGGGDAYVSGDYYYSYLVDHIDCFVIYSDY